MTQQNDFCRAAAHNRAACSVACRYEVVQDNFTKLRRHPTGLRNELSKTVCPGAE